jgi:hypothetical protein
MIFWDYTTYLGKMEALNEGKPGRMCPGFRLFSMEVCHDVGGEPFLSHPTVRITPVIPLTEGFRPLFVVTKKGWERSVRE